MRPGSSGELIIEANDPRLSIFAKAAFDTAKHSGQLEPLTSLNAQRLANIEMHSALGLELTDDQKACQTFISEHGNYADHAINRILGALRRDDGSDPVPTNEAFERQRNIYLHLGDISLAGIEQQTDTPYTINARHACYVLDELGYEAAKLAKAIELLDEVKSAGWAAIDDSQYMELVSLDVGDVPELFSDIDPMPQDAAEAFASQDIEYAQLAQDLVTYITQNCLK